MKNHIAGSLALWAASLCLGQSADPLSIRNDTLEVRCQADAGTFSVSRLDAPAPFVTAGKFAFGGGRCRVIVTTDKTLGSGQGIEIARPDGGKDFMMLFPGLPFVMFRSILHNGGGDPLVTNQVHFVSAPLDLGKPTTGLRAFGTGGLQELQQNTGSYAYLAVVDPESRAGVVGGWVTHDRGSGVLFSPVTHQRASLEAQIDYGRLRIRPGADAQTEMFALGLFDDARLGLEAYADVIARLHAIRLPSQPAGYCTWYADKYAGACDEKHILELADFAARELRPFGFSFVQIDDHWQDGISTNGPKRVFTSHRPDGPYPGGMQDTARKLEQRGLTPGLWFMPFAGTSYDPFFAAHQDWFYQDPQGRPFETRWGGTCLDMTVPGAREYLRQLVNRIAHEWGYKIFKLDGLWTGTGTRLMYVNNGYKWDDMGEAVPADPDKTQIEAFRDGLKLVRETAGPGVFLLGCCVSQNMRSFGGSFGLVDAMRVGPDTGAGHIGAPHATRNYFLHGRVWQNDPDCVSVRAQSSLNQARLNASFTAISGHLFYNSDWLPDLPAERLDILKRTVAGHGLLPRPVDLFEHDPARIWLLTDTRRGVRRDVVALFNWDQDKSTRISCPTGRIGLPAAGEFVAFDFWANKYLPPFHGDLVSALPPASCRVLAVRPVASHPQVLSTSRHVAQGIIDLLEEKWDAAALTLSGTSRVVANDLYELRLVVPLGDASFRAVGVTVLPEDAAAGVKASLTQDGPKVRATLVSSTSREIRWQAKFEPARIAAALPKSVTNLRATASPGGVVLSWDEGNAEGYRITRSGGATFDSVVAGLTDPGAEPGGRYRYAVSALGWDGGASPPVEVELAVPARPERPALPPSPSIHLADLKPLAARNGWGVLGLNRSISGSPLTVDGRRYEHGLGCHADSLLVYSIPKGARRFVAVVGIDDAKKDDLRSSIVFEVYGDVKEMGEAPVLLAASPVISSKTARSWAFNLELGARFKELRLVVTDAGDGIAADHADWVDAGFLVNQTSGETKNP